jgi:YesN/AraC family two-component response regulator
MSVQPAKQAVREVRVVIADDEPRARQALKALLATAALCLADNTRLRVHVIGEAADGQEAAQLAAERQPDVVLMDLHMPVMNGLQATRTIKSQQPGVRVVVMTVFGDQCQNALAAGADIFLLKGCAVKELLAAVLDEPDTQPATGERPPGAHSTADLHAMNHERTETVNTNTDTPTDVDRLTAQFNTWRTDLKKLKAARGTRAGAMTRVEYDRQLAGVRAQMDRAQQHLQELVEAGSAATEEMYAGVNRTWAGVTKAFAGVAARFQ